MKKTGCGIDIGEGDYFERDESKSLTEQLEGFDARVRRELEPELVPIGWFTDERLIQVVAEQTIKRRKEDLDNPLFSIAATIQRIMTQVRTEMKLAALGVGNKQKNQDLDDESFDC